MRGPSEGWYEARMYDAHSSPALDTRPGLSVRPDVLWIPVSARASGAMATAAIEAVHVLVGTLSSQLAGLHPGATLQPGRLVLTGDQSEKSSVKSEEIRLDGRLVLPLDLDADYWQRARLVAAAHELLGEAAREAGKRGLKIKLTWGTGTPRLVDADALYPVLAAVWKSRVAMLDDSRTGSAWNAPVQVDQTPISLEEVKLTLVPSQP